MTCASLESAMLRWVHAPNKGMRRIAILMFNDCSLQGAGVVAEVFQAANELASVRLRWLVVRRFLPVRRRRHGDLVVGTAGLDRRARCAALRRLRRVVCRGRQGRMRRRRRRAADCLVAARAPQHRHDPADRGRARAARSGLCAGQQGKRRISPVAVDCRRARPSRTAMRVTGSNRCEARSP